MRILGTPDPKDFRVIETIRVIRNGCGISLKDAKKLLDKARFNDEDVLLPVKPEHAATLHQELEELGLTMEPLVTAESIIEELGELNPDALLADGLEGALIGIVARFGMGPVALYDRDKCIEIFTEGMECYEDEPCDPLEHGTCEHIWEAAEEHFQFNTIGAWVGEGTPAFAVIKRKA